MYYNSYEAYSIIGDISLHLDEFYAASAFGTFLVISIVAFALTLFAAIAIKRARPYGIIVALAQPVGFYATMQYVLSYAQIDFSCLEMKVTSSVSMDDAMSKLSEKLTEAFITNIVPYIGSLVIWSLVLLCVFVMTLIYICLLIKAGYGKGLAIGALIIYILQYLFIPPVNTLPMLLEMGNSATQGIWDIVHNFAALLPLILIAIQGIVVLVGNAKAKKTAAATAAFVAAQAAANVVNAAPETPAAPEATVEAAPETEVAPKTETETTSAE